MPFVYVFNYDALSDIGNVIVWVFGPVKFLNQFLKVRWPQISLRLECRWGSYREGSHAFRHYCGWGSYREAPMLSSIIVPILGCGAMDHLMT